MHLLIIDEEEDIRLGCAEILSLKGFNADTAINRNNINTEMYDIIITTKDEPLKNTTKTIYLKKPFTAAELIKSIENNRNEQI